MPDPVVVGRALTALAHPEDVPERQSYETTIEDARDAFSDVATAAAFLDAGGEAKLRRAVGAAARDGNQCVHEGRTLLRNLSRLRAATAHEPSATHESPTTHEQSSRPRDGDHFHSGRTTVFSGDGESPNR